jgi:predicted MFS family arabinose efflux permease
LLVSMTERFPRRRVMVTADLVRVGAYLLVLVPMPVPILVLIVAVAGCTTPPFEAARSALRPELTPPELLSATVTVTQLTSDVSMLAGYLFGGVAIAVLGPYAALSANTASFAISAWLTARLPSVERQRQAAPQSLRRAAHLLSHAAPLRRALVLVLVTQAGSAGCEALAVPYAEQVIGRNGGWAAVLYAAGAVACMAATAAMPLSGDAHRLLTRCGWLCLAGGAATMVAFTWLPPWGGLVPFAAAGLLMVVLVPANVVVGPALPNHLRASAFSLLAGTTVFVQAVGAALGGVIASAISIPSAAALIAAPSLLMGLYATIRPVPARSFDQLPLPVLAEIDGAGTVTGG